MFSEKLTQYIKEILEASSKVQNGEVQCKEAWKDIPVEIKKSIATTSEGEVGEYYDYLKKLI